MGALRPMVAVLLAALNSVVTGEFQFEVEVVEFHDSVDDCGILLDVCALYIDEMCLDAGSEEPQEECSLGESDRDLDLRSGLPKRKTFSVISQPWPVDFRLCIEVMDYDLVSDDDHIEDLVVLTSLNTSSEFTEPAEFNADGRITLTLRFRVQCSGGYKGPRCSCIPRDDDENGHYSCREEGGISCLPGYTNTSNLCRQEHCAGVVCPSNGTCVNNPTSFSCEPPPPPSSPTTSSIAPRENCNCASGMACIPQEKEGQFSCVCAEGFTGEDCGTVTTSPRQQDRGPAMPAAFVAVIVAGVLVAGLLSALLVVAIVVWIRCRRRRQCKFGNKVSSRGGGPVPLKHPLSLAGQGKVVSDPTYSNPSAAEAGSNDGDTLRHMPNPLYTHSNVENPLYREHPPQREGIYSVPCCSPTSPTASQEDTQATGGGMYSEPDVEKVGDVSYATVGPAGGKDPAAIEGGEYTRPTGPPRYSEAPYDTLDHGVQSHHHTHPPLAGYSTLNHHTHPPMDHHTHPPLAGYSTLNHHKH